MLSGAVETKGSRESFQLNFMLDKFDVGRTEMIEKTLVGKDYYTREQKMRIVICGLSITSSWGNGHATTYRGLVRELSNLGHQVLFLERNVPWYASNRDLPDPPYCRTILYSDLEELKRGYLAEIEAADLVIVGSYVMEGSAVGQLVMEHGTGVKAFYDIDTPVTLAKLNSQDWDYLSPDLIPQYDLYLSFTGGPILNYIEGHYASPRARPLYYSFDPDLYRPLRMDKAYDLGYMGTYSCDRQPMLNELLIKSASRFNEGRFVVAGPKYPENIPWPVNVRRIEHLSPAEHQGFYNTQRFTLNVTRADMIRAGYSPSVRLFEAAACGVPIITDLWKGLETLFKIGDEILPAQSAEQVLAYVLEMDEEKRVEIGRKARLKVLSAHTAAHRVQQLLDYTHEVMCPEMQSVSCRQ